VSTSVIVVENVAFAPLLISRNSRSVGAEVIQKLKNHSEVQYFEVTTLLVLLKKVGCGRSCCETTSAEHREVG
jgi:hypothetical protein